MTQEGFKRKLTAILSADAVEYSRLMAEDEAETVKTLATYREVMTSLIKQHRGRVVDSPGDNVLAEFSSVVDAVHCAVAVQNEFQTRNAELAENRRMAFRIGINLGDVIDEKERIYGDGVNVAARLEALADPGGICVSKTAFDQIETKLPLGYEYLGQQSVKNIPKPVGAYRVLMKPDAAGKVIGEKRFLGRYSRRTATAAIIILVVVAVGLVSWNIYLQRSKKVEPASLEKMALPLPDKPSIAVLPFKNVSGDPEQDYIADGITENIINVFSKNPELFVIASNSVFTYKGKAVKVQQVSEDLGVRYILEGSVQKSGNQVRIHAQLIDAIKGIHLWAESYNRNFEDLFALQDEITKNILMELQVELTWGQTGHAFETKSLRAWEYAIKGLHLFYNSSKENNAKATELLNKAIELDPDYVLPLLLLGWVNLQKMQWGWSDSPADSFRQTGELAQKALEINENESMTYSLLNTLYLYKRQYDQAISAGEKAISLSPNDPLAHAIQGDTLKYAGRFEEAIKESETAIRLQPYYPGWYLRSLCMSYYYAGRYEDAVLALNQALNRSEKQKSNLGFHIVLAVNYIQLGKEKQ
ncbi:MAG: adenylate/guanylate cyclase domain-containing protein, partial [Desulfobacterales bacterium]